MSNCIGNHNGLLADLDSAGVTLSDKGYVLYAETCFEAARMLKEISELMLVAYEAPNDTNWKARSEAIRQLKILMEKLK